MLNLSRGDLRLSSISILGSLGNLEVVLYVATLCLILVRKQWGDYWALGAFLVVRLSTVLACICLNDFAPRLGVRAAYQAYFAVYWISSAVDSVIALLIVYGLFRLAMAPLKGLQTLGMLVFKWAAGISLLVALGNAFAPNVSGIRLIMAAIVQLQRTQSILTLCLLLFVCFAVRPMGLSYSSRIFGVSLGLGFMATNDLVQSAWLALNPKMETAYNTVNGVVICVILAIWASYFALPEPKRRIIVLPTTSPFLRWNQISQALGDAPGFVAVGGVPPELFAPAELEVMRRASLKMTTPAAQAEEPVSINASRAV
jgi:hypothetical protein